MPHEIRIPRLGWSMEEGTFVGWLKPPGAEVATGEPLFELEGEKALQEVESVNAGKLYVPLDAPQPGSTIPVGALLGYLLAPDEPIPSASSSTMLAPTELRPDVEIARAAPARSSPLSPSDQPIATPRAKRVAAELGIDWTTLAGTGRDGRIREADVRADVRGATPRPTGTPGFSMPGVSEQSDGDGAFVLTVEPGTMRIQASAPGTAPSAVIEREVAPGEELE